VLVIASALSIQDPRDRPMDKQDQADEAHAPFKDPSSDFLSWLTLWNAFRNQKRHLSGSKLRKWCREKFLSFVRLREWEEMHHQLTELATSMGHHRNERHATPEAVHRALPAALSHWHTVPSGHLSVEPAMAQALRRVIQSPRERR
jgi:ATP-dependent helicase HrpA